MYGIDVAVENSREYVNSYLDEMYDRIRTQAGKISEGRQKYVNQLEETELLKLKMRLSFKLIEIFLAEIVPRVSMWSSDVTTLLHKKITTDHFPEFPPLILGDRKTNRTGDGEAGMAPCRTGTLSAGLPVILLILGAILFLVPILSFSRVWGAVVFFAGFGTAIYQKLKKDRRPYSTQNTAAGEMAFQSDLQEIFNQRRQFIYSGLCRWIDEMAVEIESGITG